MHIETLISHETGDGAPHPPSRARPGHQYNNTYPCYSVSPPAQSAPRAGPSLPPQTQAQAQAAMDNINNIKREHADSELLNTSTSSDIPFRGNHRAMGSPSSLSLSSSSSPTARMKRSLTDYSDDEDEQTAAGDNGGKRVRGLNDSGSGSVDTTAAAPAAAETVIAEFACPFYKRNRGKYCHQRSCRTSGWPSVHRVKEHLYRHHMHHVCDRCSMTFKVQEQLREHLRQEVACRVAPRSVAEDLGFDAEVEKRLRSRKKIEGQNEVDKWNHMFRILFPSYTAKPTPSPFVEYNVQDGQPVKEEEEDAGDARDARDTTLQAIAMEAMATKNDSNNNNNNNKLPPIIAGAPCPQRNNRAYLPGGPHGPGHHPPHRSNADPRILSRNTINEIVQQQVWHFLSSMPNFPNSPISQN